MSKKSKSIKKRKRRKLSKLLKSLPETKQRKPTCKGSIRFKSKKDYSRKNKKNIIKKELSY